MSDTETLAPFIKWGNYKSKDPSRPDILEIRVVDPEPFPTEYSTNARVQLKEGDGWTEVILPLKSHASNNASLLTKWTELQKKGQLKEGRELEIKTWLGRTKKTDRPIRRFAISVG